MEYKLLRVRSNPKPSKIVKLQDNLEKNKKYYFVFYKNKTDWCNEADVFWNDARPSKRMNYIDGEKYMMKIKSNGFSRYIKHDILEYSIKTGEIHQHSTERLQQRYDMDGNVFKVILKMLETRRFNTIKNLGDRKVCEVVLDGVKYYPIYNMKYNVIVTFLTEEMVKNKRWV